MADLVAAESGKSVEEPTIELDAGLYYPASYAISSWMENRKHGTLPEFGAYNDQCEQWRYDMQTLNQRYNLAVWKQSNRTGELIPETVTADNWNDVFKD